MENIQHKQVAAGRAIRVPEVCGLIGASRATIWRWARLDPGFPRPFKLSPAITAWDEGEILDWIEVKKATRGVR